VSRRNGLTPVYAVQMTNEFSNYYAIDEALLIYTVHICTVYVRYDTKNSTYT